MQQIESCPSRFMQPHRRGAGSSSTDPQNDGRGERNDRLTQANMREDEDQADDQCPIGCRELQQISAGWQSGKLAVAGECQRGDSQCQ